MGRLAATSAYILTVTYGDTAAVQQAGARVRAIHRHVNGTDSVTGRSTMRQTPPSCSGFMRRWSTRSSNVVQRYGRLLDAADADRYVVEMVRFAELVGVPAEQVPAGVAALQEYMESVEPLRATPAALHAISVVLDPPGLGDDMRELWHDIGRVAIGTLPGWARSIYGFGKPDPELMEREHVRQLIGALDLGYESLPGVMEARERIELRMRQ